MALREIKITSYPLLGYLLADLAVVDESVRMSALTHKSVSSYNLSWLVRIGLLVS
jgi:hypothetical protein